MQKRSSIDAGKRGICWSEVVRTPSGWRASGQMSGLRLVGVYFGRCSLSVGVADMPLSQVTDVRREFARQYVPEWPDTPKHQVTIS